MVVDIMCRARRFGRRGRDGKMSFGKIVVLTGAGVSAESGMGTFRDKDGIWTLP